MAANFLARASARDIMLCFEILVRSSNGKSAQLQLIGNYLSRPRPSILGLCIRLAPEVGVATQPACPAFVAASMARPASAGGPLASRHQRGAEDSHVRRHIMQGEASTISGLPSMQPCQKRRRSSLLVLVRLRFYKRPLHPPAEPRTTGSYAPCPS